jgi:hypothetical protein
MPAPARWTTLALALAAVAAVAGPAPAQVKQGPGPKPGPGIKPANPVVVMPSINTLPGVPASQLFQPVFNPAFLPNPALSNPWLNPVTVTPVRVNPFAPNLLQNPFVVNPLLQNPFVNPLANPLIPGPFVPGPLVAPAPVFTSTPPIAVRQAGQLFYKGPDLQVNPTSGTVYRPLSGTATTADGTTFFRVVGSGLPTATGQYATGTGLYYSPQTNTYFNPGTGVISKPGQTNAFIPYIW